LEITNKLALQSRTKLFNIAVIKACDGLPKTAAGFELAKQLIRAAGSVGANYRASSRAKSTADFIYKPEIVIEEVEELMYWLEILEELNLLDKTITQLLIKEANELVSIFVASVKTVKQKKQ
jgi:four helix bundle protein